MTELTKDIVVAMIQSGFLIKTHDNNTNIEIVKTAIKEVYSELKAAKN